MGRVKGSVGQLYSDTDGVMCIERAGDVEMERSFKNWVGAQRYGSLLVEKMHESGVSHPFMRLSDGRRVVYIEWPYYEDDIVIHEVDRGY